MNDHFIKETISFKLDKEKIEYTIIHNINTQEYAWPVIMYRWAEKTQYFTAESLCAYINSVSHLTGAKAFTEEQFEELNGRRIITE